MAQIWRFWRRFGANCPILGVIIVVSERLRETMIGLLTIFHKPKGGNLLIAYSSLTEDGNLQ